MRIITEGFDDYLNDESKCSGGNADRVFLASLEQEVSDILPLK